MRLTSAVSRRALLGGVSGSALAAVLVPERALGASAAATPVPMEAVRLLPSAFLDAMTANAAYMKRLEPDRLLHNYREQAGLPPRDAVYGGWESETIAGHTLGHLLSALSLLHAQTGDADARRRVDGIVAELVLCQGRSPDGYVAGFTRTRDGRTEPGRVVFEEIRAGRIHATAFDLNGAWSPLYNWHKLFAGLLDADRYCGNAQALGVCTRLASYIGGVFDALDDDQVQAVLVCEYGGLNESLAELSVRTGDRRWLALAERIRDHRTLDPLSRGEDNLADLHANTQIPKVIGLARLHEITGRATDAVASATFWSAVTAHHSYVIGGNGDREYFTAPDTTSSYVTEQTCETCASYNMLKLTRYLYARHPVSAFFDYYERTQINHILAQQNPRTGMFAYMTPLMSGTRRDYSTPFNDFWCCVGTGMESHAKHGDSIFWHAGADTLLVNLFVPSQLDWNGIGLAIETDYPRAGLVTLAITASRRTRPWTLRIRVPGWSSATAARLNGVPISAAPDGRGYLAIRRRWRPGDRVALALDMRLRIEHPPGASDTVAFMRGPAVLAGDLGPASEPFDGTAPALVADDLLGGIRPAEHHDPCFVTAGIGRPRDLTLTAFAAQHDRRSAVYFPVFTEAGWTAEQARSRADEAARRALAARAADVLDPGETPSERDHALAASQSYAVTYRGRHGRDARSGGFFAFTMRTAPGPLSLRLTYWGEERQRMFRVLVDETEIARPVLDASHPGRFFDESYPIPLAMTADRSSIRIRIVPLPDHSAGPVFGAYLLPPTKETTL